MTAQQFAQPGPVDEIRALQGVFGRALVDAPDAVLVLEDECIVTYANPAAEQLLEARSADLVDRSLADMLSDGRDQLKRIDDLEPGQRIVDGCLSFRSPDGATRCMSVSTVAVEVPDLGETRRVLYLRDLRERQRTEDELRRRNEELEHCVHTLSHDLRSPLVALLGFSRLLRQDYETRLDETGRHFLDRIEQAGRTMEDLIHDLLELSRIEQSAGRRSLVDPRAVLLQLQAELKPRLDATGVTLVLPEHPPLVYCDRTRLYQVFSNLLGNAVEHMGPAKPACVHVEINDDGDRHRLVVRDHGKGIDAEHQERIFQVFQSLGPRRDGQRGTGIGLAIVRKIAELHGGRAWVDSEPGAGSAFHVTLQKA